ncbi:MAG: transcriptional repressor NrdR [Deinococcus sp.]|nr:transcriptional repressor NrdR [Deinococcus sp.]
MRCPHCGSQNSKVIDSRPSDGGAAIRRRRECEDCDSRFTTYERIQLEPLMVIKRDGRREAFNPEKLLRSLEIACEKRPVDPKLLRKFVIRLEDDLGVSEVESAELGRRALGFLRELDKIAFVRFASVYKGFSDPQDFVREIEALKTLQ